MTPEIGIEIVKDGESALGNGIKSKIHVPENDQRMDLVQKVEPLAFFELEPCLPYPFAYRPTHYFGNI